MSVNNRQILSLLGLSAKAGGVQSGEFATEKAVREGKAFAVIVASDASVATKKNFTNLCAYYKVPVRFLSEKEELGHSIGRMFRASVAVTNESLAGKILQLIDADN